MINNTEYNADCIIGIRIYMAKTINKLNYDLLYEFVDELWKERVKLVPSDILKNPLVKFQTLHIFGLKPRIKLWLDNPYFSIAKLDNL